MNAVTPRVGRGPKRPLGSHRPGLAAQLAGLASAWQVLRAFRADLRPFRREMAVAVAGGLAYTLTRLAEPWPLKIIFDSVLADHPLVTGWAAADARLADRTVVLLLAVSSLVGLAFLRGVFYYFEDTRSSRVGQAVVLGIRARVFAHLQRLPLAYHARASTGDLLTRMTGDILMLRDILVSSVVDLFSEVVVLAGIVVIMAFLNWRLALVGLAVLPTVFVLLMVYSGRIRQAVRDQRRREGEVAGRLQQVLVGMHVVQLFGGEARESSRLADLNARSLESGVRASVLEANMNRSVELALAVATAVTLLVGAQQVLAGQLTTGGLVVFISYLGSFYKPLRRVSRLAERSSKAATCAERVLEVLEAPLDLSDGPLEAGRVKGRITFAGVSFAYDPRQPVLTKVSLDIEAGQTVALVGASGAGKSTLASLVPRLMDPTAGAILLDGVDVRQFTLRSLREQVSVVPQDGMLFGGTIAENIAYGRPDAPPAAMEAAARAAHIHDFIVSLPKGYLTPVGERGVTLSGGQRQRLAIARAMLKDAPVVILDEPTTGLDAASEALVMAAMRKLLAGRTALVIAHRLNTVREADVVVVLDQGQVVEVGRHDALMAKDGVYAGLYRRQSGGRGKLGKRISSKIGSEPASTAPEAPRPMALFAP